MAGFAAWVGARRCTSGPQPGAKALMAWFEDTVPTGRNQGIYNCRDVRGKETTSLHGEGRAVDLGFPTIRGRANPVGDRIAELLIKNASRLGIQCIIWNRRIWSVKHPRGARYNGVAPHYDHIHVELSWKAARSLTKATVRSVLGGASGGKLATNKSALPVVDASYIYPGSKASAVKTVQKALNEALGIDLEVDGDYGPATRAAAKKWQVRLYGSGDGIDGDLGVQSLTALGASTHNFRVVA